MILLQLFVWIFFIVVHAVVDYREIEYHNSKPNYLVSFIIRGIAAILHGIMMDVTKPEEWWPILIFQVTSFWVLFSPILNLLRGKPFLYLGEDSGWIDRFFINRKSFYLSVYILVSIICTLSTILIYEFNT